MADRLTSSIFWGPPAPQDHAGLDHRQRHEGGVCQVNAVTSGVAEVRDVIRDAESRLKLHGRATYLLLDECHRWSQSPVRQHSPSIEQGIIRFVGSTTENPMIAMTPAIVSRCRLFHFEPLTRKEVGAGHPERRAGRGAAVTGAEAVTIDEDALATSPRWPTETCAPRSTRWSWPC
jgi:putative ATPase